MPEYKTSIDVEPWEYVQDCSKWEIKELIESLIENEHLSKDSVKKFNDENKHFDHNDDFFNNNLTLLFNRRHLLTTEEEDIISKIASRFS
jgi:hypothetical protein